MNRDSPSKAIRSAIPGNKQLFWFSWLTVCIYCVFFLCVVIITAHLLGDTEEPYPSLSDFHDHEPNLEFDDTELQQPVPPGGIVLFLFSFDHDNYILGDHLIVTS